MTTTTATAAIRQLTIREDMKRTGRDWDEDSDEIMRNSL